MLMRNGKFLPTETCAKPLGLGRKNLFFFLKTSNSVKTEQNFPTVFDLHVLSSSGSDGI